MGLESNQPRFKADHIIYQSDIGMKFEPQELISSEN